MADLSPRAASAAAFLEASTEAFLAAGTTLVFVTCMVAMVLISRHEARRRAVLDDQSRRVHEDLAETGYRYLLTTPIILSFIVLVIYNRGTAVVPGLLFGGAAALASALGATDSVARLRDPDYLRRLSPGDRLLHLEVMRLRRPWLMAVATVPFFAGAILYHQLAGAPDGAVATRDVLVGTLFGIMEVGLITWGVQYVQVLRALQRERARGR